MSVQAVHAVVHTPSQVQEIVNEAIKIANLADAPEATALAIFNKACDLLGQRATTFLVPQQVPLDLASLKTNNG